MNIDGGIGNDLTQVPDQAQKAEDAGYDAVWAAETGHDPFFSLLLAAEHTERIGLGTAIVVAFARSPMTVASAGWDLNAYSNGRLLLGLGSQIKPHIEKRYSMPWSHPAPRMREFISAMRAIWDCWQNGAKLDFRGDFYTHTLMTPFFNPGPNVSGAPKVYLAAVGETMTRVAGEVADGMLVHGFTTERYLRQVTLPAIEAGLAKSGRSCSDFEISYPAFVVTGDTEEEIAAASAGTRKQIAFYGSTPAYRPVLDAHGWGDLQPELHTLSKRGEWDQMGDLISDEVLDAFAVIGSPEDIPHLLEQRFGDIVDRISLYRPYSLDGRDVTPRILAGFKNL
ncbi:MAG: LLM class F420-dependent oxidoreductase [Acidimicrobiales bacterium]